MPIKRKKSCNLKLQYTCTLYFVFTFEDIFILLRSELYTIGQIMYISDSCYTLYTSINTKYLNILCLNNHYSK